jgi:predicted nucleic acid-binding protein
MYLETTVFNFFFADDSPEKRNDTVELFRIIKEGQFKPYTSRYVIDELSRASEEKATRMLGLIREYNIEIFDTDAEAEQLASLYVVEGIIPEKYLADAIHIAIAVVKNMDFIVSYNFKHIVKRKTIEETELINIREGYKRIGIYSPAEVVY